MLYEVITVGAAVGIDMAEVEPVRVRAIGMTRRVGVEIALAPFLLE